MKNITTVQIDGKRYVKCENLDLGVTIDCASSNWIYARFQSEGLWFNAYWTDLADECPWLLYHYDGGSWCAVKPRGGMYGFEKTDLEDFVKLCEEGEVIQNLKKFSTDL